MIFSLWHMRENHRVVAYTIHEPPRPPADRADRAERIVFVKDGFSWLAALLTPFWMLAKRLWLEFALFVALALAVTYGLKALGYPDQLASLVMLVVQIAIGFEAGNLVRWALERRGWTTLGAITGRNLADCERRFFDEWLPSQPVLSAAADEQPAIAANSGWRRRLVGVRA